MDEILACRVCMSTNVKLYDMCKNQLLTPYEILTGLEVKLPSKLPTRICGVCSILLLKCTQFRETCQRTHDLLTFAYQQSNEVSTDYIESLKLNYHPLLNLSVHTTVNPGQDKPSSSVKKSVKPELYSQSDLPPVKNEIHDDLDDTGADNDFKYEVTVEVSNLPKEEKDDSLDDAEPSQDSRFDELFTVKFLTKKQQLEEVQARKDSANYKSSVYKCEKCFKGFMTESTFKNHLVKHDPCSGRYECEICGVRLPKKIALKAHNARSHEREYRCKEEGCTFVVKARCQALAHTKWHNGQVFVCKTCGATFRKRTSHLSHVRLLHPSKHVCRVCGDSFIGIRGLVMHRRKKHQQTTENDISAEATDFACDKCKVNFLTKDALAKHKATAAGDCASCNACVHCGENVAESDIKEHALTHIERKKCEPCNKTFRHERAHALHMQKVHLRSSQPAVKPIEEATFVCEICGKKFKTNGHLTYHRRKHTGETPFACTFCPKKYALRQYLKVHIRKHTGETPFPCGECPKRFTDKAALSRHLRVHTGEKPYACDYCGKCFSQSNALKLHIKTVHLKEPTPYKRKVRKKPRNIDFPIIG